MLKKFEWFFKVSRVGVTSQLDSALARRVIFSNILFVSLPIVYAIFMVIDYKTYLLSIDHLRFDQFIVPIVILICTLCLWLNKINQSGISRNLFLVSWPLLMHIIPIKLLSAPSDYFFAYPVGIIFHSIMIQLMLSYKNQTRQFSGWMAANFLTLLFAPAFLLDSDSYHHIPSTLIDNQYYALDSILYWLLFNLVVFYTIIELERYIRFVHTSKVLIENQKDELATLNQNLEKVVRLRTLALEEQNQKLKNYAFYNAHELRGPFCRVKGLIYLFEISNNPKEIEEIKDLIKKSLDELDKKIAEIQLIVQQEERS